jgi:PAS domain S-box-containing protein
MVKKHYTSQFIKTEKESSLREAIRQLETIFKSVPNGITVENRQGMVVYANDEITKFFGFNGVSSIKGKNIQKIFQKFEIKDKFGNSVPLNELPAAKLFKTNKEIIQTLHFRHKKSDKEWWFLIKATAVQTEQKKPQLAVKIFHDITEDIEEQKRRDLFVGLVSHEIRNPLTSIKAFTQLLHKRIETQEFSNAFDYTKSIEDQVNRVVKIIDDLMDITRISGGLLKINPKVTSIDEVIDQVIQDFKPAAPEMKIYKRGRIGEKVALDETRINQVLVNLLANATKYAEEGKKIEVKAKKRKDHIIIGVKDYGPGIPIEKQKEIFKLFSRSENSIKRNPTGLGLGLYISTAIVRSHNGKLWIKSKPGKGATFYFSLPIKRS